MDDEAALSGSDSGDESDSGSGDLEDFVVPDHDSVPSSESEESLFPKSRHWKRLRRMGGRLEARISTAGGRRRWVNPPVIDDSSSEDILEVRSVHKVPVVVDLTMESEEEEESKEAGKKRPREACEESRSTIPWDGAGIFLRK